MKKVGSSVSKAVEAVVPSQREEERPARRDSRRGREDVYRPGVLAPGAAACRHVWDGRDGQACSLVESPQCQVSLWLTHALPPGLPYRGPGLWRRSCGGPAGPRSGRHATLRCGCPGRAAAAGGRAGGRRAGTYRWGCWLVCQVAPRCRRSYQLCQPCFLPPA